MNNFSNLNAQCETSETAKVNCAEIYTSASDTRANWKETQRARRFAGKFNAVAKSIERNERKSFRPIGKQIAKLAKQIRGEVESVLNPQRQLEDALMSL